MESVVKPDDEEIWVIPSIVIVLVVWPTLRCECIKIVRTRTVNETWAVAPESG